ncbi:MAG TPA: hypothetical protein VJB89_02820 [Candidatus Nanoarchaeia archaeon]|nr:hypothetical protein [Candidatus Nanoarchaeia archaeon]
MKSKKGVNEGKAVMIIILIIAFMIALYVLFLPPEERARLLGEDEETITTTPKTNTETIELFAESSGKLTPLREYITTKNIPSFNLFTKESVNTKPVSSSLYISKSFFNKNYQKINFNIDDPTQKSSLYFTLTEENTGVLRIYLNNNLFFSEEITKNEIKIIDIPENLLKTENTLYFTLSGPGIKFWSSNEVHLKEIGLRQEILTTDLEESRTFNFPQDELSDLKSAKLTFYQFCNKDLITKLNILLNNKELYQSTSKCDSKEIEVDIPLQALDFENILYFTIDKGDYSFNQVKIETETKELRYPTYTFEVSNKDYNNLESAILKIEFPDSELSKNAIFWLNNHQILMKTRSSLFEAEVTSYLEQGSNYLKIEPSNSFEYTSIKIISNEG